MKLKLYYIFFIFECLNISFSFAQGFNTLDAQFFYKKFLFNPAYAGSKELLDGWYGLRTSEVNMQGRPVTMAISIDAPFVKQTGLGTNIEYSSSGSFTRIRSNLAYSYKLKLAEQNVHLGIVAGFFSETLDRSKIGNDDKTAQVMKGYEDLPASMEAGVGISYSYQTFDLGISFPSIKRGRLSSVSVLEKPMAVINSSYEIAFVTDEIHIIAPTITYIRYRSYQSQFLLGAEYSFAEKLNFYGLYNPATKGISAGMTFHKDKSLMFMLGYSSNMGKVYQNFGGSVEFGLGFSIPYEKIKKQLTYFGL